MAVKSILAKVELAMVKLESRTTGLAETVLGCINFLRLQQGVNAGSSAPKRGVSFLARASQLWRFSQGSNAAVLNKIGKCGTANAKELAAMKDPAGTQTV